MNNLRAFSFRKYYKYVFSAWTQPTLTSDGVIGGDTMAVAKVYSTTNTKNGTAYMSFEPNTGKNGFYCNEYKGFMRFIIYLPQKTKMEYISFKIATTGSEADGNAYRMKLYDNYPDEDDNIVLNIGTVSAGNTYSSSITDAHYSHFYTLYLENGGVGKNDKVTISNIYFRGQIREIVEATPQNYDFYRDCYQPIKQSGQYYAIKEGN